MLLFTTQIQAFTQKTPLKTNVSRGVLLLHQLVQFSVVAQ